MTFLEILAFKQSLEDAEPQVEGVVLDAVVANRERINGRVVLLHSNYPSRPGSIKQLKEQLVEQYAAKDGQGNAYVTRQRIRGQWITDYDYGNDRNTVERLLEDRITAIENRRVTINAVQNAQVQVNWDMVDEDDVPVELRSSLAPMINAP